MLIYVPLLSGHVLAVRMYRAYTAATVHGKVMTKVSVPKTMLVMVEGSNWACELGEGEGRLKSVELAVTLKLLERYMTAS